MVPDGDFEGVQGFFPDTWGFQTTVKEIWGDLGWFEGVEGFFQMLRGFKLE